MVRTPGGRAAAGSGSFSPWPSTDSCGGWRCTVRPLPDGGTIFGVAEGACVCWLGADHWQVSGDSGRDLGWALWRAFLDAGGPRPTEFTLQASPDRDLLPSRPAGYLRQGCVVSSGGSRSSPRTGPGGCRPCGSADSVQKYAAKWRSRLPQYRVRDTGGGLPDRVVWFSLMHLGLENSSGRTATP